MLFIRFIIRSLLDSRLWTILSMLIHKYNLHKQKNYEIIFKIWLNLKEKYSEYHPSLPIYLNILIASILYNIIYLIYIFIIVYYTINKMKLFWDELIVDSLITPYNSLRTDNKMHNILLSTESYNAECCIKYL